MGAAIGVLWIGSARAAEPAHLSWAELLVDTVTPASNHYGDPAQVLWKGAGGLTHSTNRSKCASLVTQMLTRAYAPDMAGWFGCTSPHAATYHDAIEVEDGFVLIESIEDVRAGEILAIRYLDAGCEVLSCGSFTGCTSSGHGGRVQLEHLVRIDVLPAQRARPGDRALRGVAARGRPSRGSVGARTRRLCVARDRAMSAPCKTWSCTGSSAP